MDPDYQEFKKKQRAALKQQREESSPSILDCLTPSPPKTEEKPVTEEKDKATNSRFSITVCKVCKGKKFTKTLFHKLICEVCYGTGLDTEEPENLIVQLALNCEQQEKEILKLERKIHLLETTEEERMEASVLSSQKGRYYKGD